MTMYTTAIKKYILIYLSNISPFSKNQKLWWNYYYFVNNLYFWRLLKIINFQISFTSVTKHFKISFLTLIKQNVSIFDYIQSFYGFLPNSEISFIQIPNILVTFKQSRIQRVIYLLTSSWLTLIWIPCHLTLDACIN